MGGSGTDSGPGGGLIIEAVFGLAAIAALIALNGLFVAGEFSLVAVDPSTLERRAESGSRAARLARSLLRRLSFTLAGAQLGITVSSLVLGLVAQDSLAPLFEALPGVESARGATGAVVALLIATFTQMLLGEMIPKNLAIARPVGLAQALAPFMKAFNTVAGPVIAGFNGLANLTVRMLGVEPTEELERVRSRGELAHVIRSSAEQGTLAGEQTALLLRTIRFGENDAADALVPRTEVVGVPGDATIGDLRRIARESGLSRFPVYGEDLDDVVGVVDVRDVFRIPDTERDGTPVSEIMTEALFVPESRELDDVYQDLKRSGSRLAVVVDEHGGTAGIITREDLLEEIVGDIADEYDDPIGLTVVRRSGAYELEGSLHTDEVEELLGIDIPEGPYETLAGFLLDRFGRIPTVGDSVEWSGWVLTVTGMDGRRVSRVSVTPPALPGDAGSGARGGNNGNGDGNADSSDYGARR